MLSVRRMRVFGIVVLVITVYILYLTGNTRAAQNSPDFYKKTKEALDRERSSYSHQVPSSSINDEEDAALAEALADRLKDAESVAKSAANAKSPRPQGLVAHTAGVVGQGAETSDKATGDRNVAGRKKYPIDGSGSQKPIVKEEMGEEHDVEVELNNIFKRSPIIIFSKTYCPHSRRAKTILLERYSIVPAPYVVELDEHPLGGRLQTQLATMTGRRTVPNVLVNGKSIGGGDEIAELDKTNTLIDKLRNMVGKRMQELKLRSG